MGFKYYKAKDGEVLPEMNYSAGLFIGGEAFLKAEDTVKFPKTFAEIPQGAFDALNTALIERPRREAEERAKTYVSSDDKFRAAILLSQAKILARLNTDNG